jgi:hypothetical protein
MRESAPLPLLTEFAGGTKVETILLLFTTSTAFLAGLFAPSPVAKNDGG